MDERYPKDQEEIYSYRMKAGKRTYFFDVKATRGQDYYLTITESKRRPGADPDGPASYEKHKIFLYKEDFNKFIDALHDAVDYVRDELLTPEEVAELDRPRPERADSPDGQLPRPDGQQPDALPDLGDSTY
ncbi:PUR family DNA/RNA-binding protein [Hymenobacter sp. RP-2-7]|uniref:PUR family DNA/RNA-binding protein n=1 Tax=Hymenobacter polaris TaxID=2682546 RepID=A0A7Y0FLL6_9BACT|nr:PUR family DNA/RNA-binding protein [Hymenobacter polaris]NML64933.1 PUR family DNA/RNA-binding protein [Hymenobacter polaris]